MNIALKLTLAQEAWIEAAVARGDFASPEEALASIIDFGISALETEPEDDMDEEELANVREKLAEAERSIANGESLTLEEHRRRMARVLEELKS